MMTRIVLRYISMIYTDKFRCIDSYPERATAGLYLFPSKSVVIKSGAKPIVQWFCTRFYDYIWYRRFSDVNEYYIHKQGGIYGFECAKAYAFRAIYLIFSQT